jgi:transposase-like protein
MECPECKSTITSKNGHKRGKLSLPLPQLGRQFVDLPATNRGYNAQLKPKCLKMYVNGMGLPAIERGHCVFIIQPLLLG